MIEATYQLVGADSDESWPARVMNLSSSGVGLSVNHSVEVGKLLNVELHAAGHGDGRTLLCCAVHVAELSGGEWLVGCNFITELEESDLNLLLGN